MVKVAYKIQAVEDFKKIFPDYKKYNVEVYLDETEDSRANSIATYLKQNEKKFKRILHVILSGKYDKDFYSQEGREIGIKNATALKFKGRYNSNTRIYCKEIFKNGKKVILITSLSKKVQKNDKNINVLLKSIAKSEYELKNKSET